ncbi:MAG: menaquinone biosynthesis decarboxylase [Deltaproteobacteria bacterium]|nr:menaquinone biosynthesis decarboxylase [Deltaproteobacteria bacterium]
MFEDLRDYLNALEKRGELKKIKKEVDPVLEMGHIADRVVKQGGPALLFEKVKGSNISVVMNLFGTERRMAFALGVEDLNDLEEKLKDFLEPEAPVGLLRKLKLISSMGKFLNFKPKIVSKGRCQEIVEREVDLGKLPVLKTWPKDGGRFFTLPLVFTKNPVTGILNCGMYRMQVMSKDSTAMHWHRHKDGAKHYRMAKERKEKLPVCVALGCDPAVIYSATLPLPEEVEEMFFAGILRGKSVEMVKAKSVDMLVPANAEIVLEGFVDTQEDLVLEGPFGDHTGYYSQTGYFPLFHVTCITHRKNPIYPATIVGKPPMEDAFLGKATERLFLPVIKKIIPEVVDINLPVEGVFHNFAFVSIEKSYPGQAFKVINALWGLGLLSLAKNIVVFDRYVNVQDISEVLWRWGCNVDPLRDTIFTKGPLDELDHSSPRVAFGSKMGIDATKKWEGETERPFPDDLEMDEEVVRKVDISWKDYGF